MNRPWSTTRWVALVWPASSRWRWSGWCWWGRDDAGAEAPPLVLALIGCFALAFGTALVFELMLIWLLEIRLRLPYESVANFLVTMWRTVASLSIAGCSASGWPAVIVRRGG